MQGGLWVCTADRGETVSSWLTGLFECLWKSPYGTVGSSFQGQLIAEDTGKVLDLVRRVVDRAVENNGGHTAVCVDSVQHFGGAPHVLLHIRQTLSVLHVEVESKEGKLV